MSFLISSPLLVGDNRVPGLELSKEVKDLVPRTLQICKDFGLDFFPTVVQPLTGDEMSEVASYGGFPVRYPHWQWGMQYEENQRGYELGLYKIFEMVINNDPCYMWLLVTNTMVDHITVIVHATGHNHFFKNNIYFSQTSRNMMNTLAQHATAIRKYQTRYGRERVTEFIDHILSLETLVDPAKAWEDRYRKDPVIRDHKTFRHPTKIPVPEGHDYMDPYINPPEYMEREKARIRKLEMVDELGLFSEPTKDILKFLMDHAPLKPWQQDIMSMIYEEAMYFAPQRQTKMLNEGFASWCDSKIMAGMGLVAMGQKSHDCGIFEYAKHKMMVLGGEWSMNPYKIGYELLLDIEDRWNKGMFGQEWKDCKDMKLRENWDKQVGKGKEKVFEVTRYHDDVTALAEYFTQEFCDKNQFFEWKKYPDGKYVVESKDAKKIKKKLIRRYINGGLPEICLVDPNYKNKRYMLLEHKYDGRPLHEPYARATLTAINYVWQNDVFLSSRNKDGEEIVYYCQGPGDSEKDVIVMTREEYERKW